MGLKLVEVKDDSEFYELARVEREAFENPDERLLELYFPQHGVEGEEAVREASIKEAAERQIAWRHADPTSTWIKVVDEDTGKLLGAALWHVYDKDPYAEPSEHDEGCTWFAKGFDRDVANDLIGQFFVARTTYMRTPHVFLNICFTGPDARRRGVGSLLLNWGVQEADKRGYVSYIDASNMGKELYKNFAFVKGDPTELSLNGYEDTPRFRELQKKLLPCRWWPMYRPVGGKFDENTKLPWTKASA